MVSHTTTPTVYSGWRMQMSHQRTYNCSICVTLGVQDRESGLENSVMKMSPGTISEALKINSVTLSKTMVTGGWPTLIGRFTTIKYTSARSSHLTGHSSRSMANG